MPAFNPPGGNFPSAGISAGPTVDSHGNVYMATGNGPYDPSQHNWGDTVFSLNPDGTGLNGNPLDTYTPANYQSLDSTDADLKELRSEYITVRSQLEKKEQQSQVAAGIGELGLRESRVPPAKIQVEADELESTRRP